jgi:hypothetical protein
MNLVGESEINRFQAMANIMVKLCEDGSLKPGTPEYKVARKLVARKIDNLGSDDAFEQAKRWKGRILDEVRMLKCSVSAAVCSTWPEVIFTGQYFIRPVLNSTYLQR